ncbi:TraC family protein [Aureimonas pseudogalii]|uniref:Conjugal transfer protein TraC n=1 Tax=Aureimonas pseudogalii TaxID=1744844 RepID=A0A7W6H816_9HYPH|nr:TraC family protein [Aureimonas pseudogalii]MBB4000121.1 hypothetical protein [Aureimonas pseudogalii]
MARPKANNEGSQSRSAVLRKQMDDLKAELRQVEVAEEAAFGKMARKAGLFELNVPDKDLREAVASMVATFRGNAGQKDDTAKRPQTETP